MYIVQTVHTGLMLDVHCADCTYRNNVKMYILQTVHTGLMLDVHCALYIQD